MKKIMPLLLLMFLIPACAHHSRGFSPEDMHQIDEPKGEHPGERVKFEKLDPKVRKALGLKKDDLLLAVKSDGSNVLYFNESKQEFTKGSFPLGRKLGGIVTILSTNSVRCKTIDIAGRTYWFPRHCP